MTNYFVQQSLEILKFKRRLSWDFQLIFVNLIKVEKYFRILFDFAKMFKLLRNYELWILPRSLTLWKNRESKNWLYIFIYIRYILLQGGCRTGRTQISRDSDRIAQKFFSGKFMFWDFHFFALFLFSVTSDKTKKYPIFFAFQAELLVIFSLRTPYSLPPPRAESTCVRRGIGRFRPRPAWIAIWRMLCAETLVVNPDKERVGMSVVPAIGWSDFWIHISWHILSCAKLFKDPNSKVSHWNVAFWLM